MGGFALEILDGNDVGYSHAVSRNCLRRAELPSGRCSIRTGRDERGFSHEKHHSHDRDRACIVVGRLCLHPEELQSKATDLTTKMQTLVGKDPQKAGDVGHHRRHYHHNKLPWPKPCAASSRVCIAKPHFPEILEIQRRCIPHSVKRTVALHGKQGDWHAQNDQ